MPRLGDNIDDYCSRCKLPTDHSVVSAMGEEVLKTRCRTCGFEHNYRHNKGGKGPMTNQQAFEQVMASVMGSASQPLPKAAKGKKKKPAGG